MRRDETQLKQRRLTRRSQLDPSEVYNHMPPHVPHNEPEWQGYSHNDRGQATMTRYNELHQYQIDPELIRHRDVVLGRSAPPRLPNSWLH